MQRAYGRAGAARGRMDAQDRPPELAALTAVDVSPERLTRVTQNLQRLGLSARVFAADAGEPASWWDGKPFDRILLDVPCSATGVIRRHPDIKLLRRSDDIAALATRQSQLLRTSWTMLAPGGRLLYASCSALQAETTGVIEAFLADEPGARDATGERLAGMPGFVTGTRAGGHGLRIAAGSAGMDGFYYALLDKRC